MSWKKSRLRVLSAVVTAVGVVTALTAVLSAPASAAGSNLVANPGFETGSLSPWTCDGSTGSVVTSPVHSGSDALAGAANSSDDAQCAQTISVQPNSAYTLSAYVEGNYVYIGATGYSSTWTPSATSWQQLSTSFTTGASTTSVVIYLHGWYAQGTYYADDVSLTGPGGTVQVPAAPTGLKSTGTTSSSVSLSWTASTGATGYNVYRNGAKVGSSTGTTYTDTGLSASTAYSYTVTATNSAGESTQSAAVSVTTSGVPTVPPAPTGLSVSGTTSSSVSLSWSASSGATGYNVYRGGSKVGSSTSTSYTDSGLSASTTYSYTVTATNSAGESAQSGAVSATTSGTSTGGSLPKHVLTGYWQDFTNNAKALRLSDTPAGYNLVAVAFANTDGTNDGGVTFSVDSGLSTALGGYTDAQFKADVQTLHSRGQKVIVSVGGQDGAVSVASSSAATNFANSVYSIMQSYGFDGVDIDLENGVNPTYMTQALQSLSSKVGSSLIITLAPQTIDMQSTGMAYFQLALDIKSILTIANTQYYNSGSMNGCDNAPQPFSEGNENFITALACIQLEGGLRPDQVGVGLPASSGAAGSGYVSPSVVNSALDCLASGTNCGSFVPSGKWPAIRGAMTWSINWDASNGYSFVNTVAPHLASMP